MFFYISNWDSDKEWIEEVNNRESGVRVLGASLCHLPAV